MQKTKDQVQWRDTMPTLREPQPGVRLRAQLLQLVQRQRRVQANVNTHNFSPAAG